MMVYIVIFDRKAYQISSKLFADINAYIDDRYVEEHRDSYAERISRLHSLAAEESCPIPAAPMVTKAASLDDALKQIDESFSEMLLRKIDECGMTDAECYTQTVPLLFDFNVVIANLNKLNKDAALDLISKLKESITVSVGTNEEYLTEYSNIPLVGKTIIEQQGLLYKTLLEWLDTFREQFERID